MVLNKDALFTTETFQVGSLNLFARRYGTKGGVPVIALHGWMDNCASFEFLAPLMDGCDLVCLDCAGHGLSDHRTHLGAYNIWQDIAEVFAVADSLGWNEFSLLGHSRGAICCFLAAGTLPDRVKHLLLIEGVYPPLARPDQAPENLANAVTSLLDNQNRDKRYYPTFEQAAIARANGIVPVSLKDARALAQHGTKESEQGVSWLNDSKLIIGSELRLSLEQVKAFQARVTADTLVVVAEQGLLFQNELLMETLTTFSEAKVVRRPGGHHLHMSSHSYLVAESIMQQIGLLP